MTQTRLAENYKIGPTSLREIPDLERVAEVGARPGTRRREGELSSDAAAILLAGSSAASAARSRLRLLCARFVKRLKDCAEAYAAATAYENLSRLSDAELRRRSLSRDVLARDLAQ
jgi:hypothetical protein